MSYKGKLKTSFIIVYMPQQGVPEVVTSTVYILLTDVPESNTKWAHHLAQIEDSIASYKNCDPEKCSCHYPLIKKDLAVFKNGIGKDVLQAARDR